MSELAPPKLSGILREELRKLLREGVYTARDISDAISPSALSRFLNGAEEEAGLRINTFERILQKINGYTEVFFNSLAHSHIHYTDCISVSERAVVHQPVCLALGGGPAAIYGRNGECYAINEELRRFLGFDLVQPSFAALTPVHKDRQAHQQFLQHVLRRPGDVENTSSDQQSEPSQEQFRSGRADLQTPLRIFEVAVGCNADATMFVGQVARLLDCTLTDTIRREFGGELLVVSFSDATEIQLRLEELDTLWRLLNDPFNQINMHVVEPSYSQQTQKMDYSKVTFVSNAARSLLQIDKNAKDIRLSDFVCADKDELASRMRDKFEKGNLSTNRSRTFHQFRREGRVLPVAVHDYGVAEVRPNGQGSATALRPLSLSKQSQHPRRFAKIFTLWRQTRIPEDIMKILEIYGARNPVLAQAGIETLVKSPVSGDTKSPDYKLIYTNTLFRAKHESRFRNLSPANEPLESQVFNGAEDVKLQEEYHRIDDRVLQRAKETGVESSLERIERHRYPDRKYEASDDVDCVHVVKIAVQEPVSPGAAEKRWVLHVFFWPADREQEEQVFAALRAYYSAWRMLDSLPLPVYAKDSTLSLLYANQAYIDDVREAATETRKPGETEISIAKQRDVVGKRDGLFFEASQALKFESDDRRLLSGHISELHCREAHGNREVRVWKKAVSFPAHGEDTQLVSQSRGIIGVYCTIAEDNTPRGESAPPKARRGRPPGTRQLEKNSLTSPDKSGLFQESGHDGFQRDGQPDETQAEEVATPQLWPADSAQENTNKP